MRQLGLRRYSYGRTSGCRLATMSTRRTLPTRRPCTRATCVGTTALHVGGASPCQRTQSPTQQRLQTRLPPASRCLPRSGKIFFFTFPDARIMLRHVMDCSYNAAVIFADRYLYRCRRGVDVVRGAYRGQPAACGQEGVSEWPTTPRTVLP